jgi:hypothetical protein
MGYLIFSLHIKKKIKKRIFFFIYLLLNFKLKKNKKEKIFFFKKKNYFSIYNSQKKINFKD